LDNDMPMMSGVQVAMKLREGQQAGQIDPDLKIALSSGDNAHDFDALARNAHGNTLLFDFNLGKPVNLAMVTPMLL
jgi:CheY-like chemotaxis protein